VRILLGCLLVLGASATFAPTSEELHTRYGAPDEVHRDEGGVLASESFNLPSGVRLTASYGSDQHACQLGVTSILEFEKLFHFPYLTDTTTAEVLEELVPVASRGDEFGSGTKNSILFTEYKNVLISESHNLWGVLEATISFKREGCPKPDNPFVFRPPPPPPDAKTVLALTPTSEELHKRYAPKSAWTATEVFDVFKLQPDIQLRVKYGPDHHSCQMEMRPADGLNPYMPTERVSEILSEVAPAAMRGKPIFGDGEFRSSQCGGVRTSGYENVAIARYPNYCAPGHTDTEKYVIIQFRRDGVCPDPYTHASKSQPNFR